IGLAEADQCPRRALARAAAAELQRLGIEQTDLLLMVQPVQQHLVAQSQELLGAQGIGQGGEVLPGGLTLLGVALAIGRQRLQQQRSEEHTSELQSRENLVCRLLLEKK